MLQVFQPVWIIVRSLTPVVRQPLEPVLGNEWSTCECTIRVTLYLTRIYLEEHPCLDHVPLVKCETVVDASGEENEVSSVDYEPDPLIGGVFYLYKPTKCGKKQGKQQVQQLGVVSMIHREHRRSRLLQGYI